MTHDHAPDAEALARRVAVAAGRAEGDLLLRGGRCVNVFTQRVETGDVVIVDGWIAGVGPHAWEARRTVDVSGAVIAPGLIDAHVHIESTLLTPAAFAAVVVPRGTASVIADPHEIGNVLGVAGIEDMIRASRGLPLDCWFMAPSCVPASPFERAGAVLEGEAIDRLLANDRILGLAEMMNFPGVVQGDVSVLGKVAGAAAARAAVDGHCPGLLGRDLVAYAAAGIQSDHECTTAEEARQRAALGMLVQVREGSMARNLDEMLPLIAAGELDRWCLCTDDVLAEDLLADGHIDALLKRVVAAGIPAAHAIRHATLVPAVHYGLPWVGAVAPGYRADLAVFDDLVGFEARLVLKDGAVVAEDGDYRFAGATESMSESNSVRLGPIDDALFGQAVAAPTATVIEVVPDQIVTRRAERAVASADGAWVFDPELDVALIACVQRHEPSGEGGCGLVSGFGFARHGAIGSSVAHDAHNLIVAGTNPRDMRRCCEALAEIGGGFVVIEDGAPTATMPLPVAGLLSPASADEVCRQQRTVDAAAAHLGCTLHSPFGTLSFLALTVIPELRMTDQGLFDVETFELVP
jgi:adenine deaminase